jgi:hypothetical protein
MIFGISGHRPRDRGVLAYSVALRRRESGIRAALGASSSTLLRAVLFCRSRPPGWQVDPIVVLRGD